LRNAPKQSSHLRQQIYRGKYKECRATGLNELRTSVCLPVKMLLRAIKGPTIHCKKRQAYHIKSTADEWNPQPFWSRN